MIIKLNIFAQHQQKASGAVMGMRTGEQQEGREGGCRAGGGGRRRAHFRPAAALTHHGDHETHIFGLFLTGEAVGEARGLHSDVCGAVRKHGSTHSAGPGPVERTRFVRVTAGRSGQCLGRPQPR